jgi:uncharacterized membrane protein YhaH (DUF805 family)
MIMADVNSEWRQVDVNPLSWRGRVGRLQYLWESIGIPAGLAALVSYGAAFLSVSEGAFVGLVLSAVLAILLIHINTGIKRCHDLKRSGFFLLWLWVPFANVVAIFYLLFSASKWTQAELVSQPLPRSRISRT